MTNMKRLYIGGLPSDITEKDLTSRFARFGGVKNIELKAKTNVEGKPIHTFAYVNLNTTEEDLKKCYSTYNNTKWKGKEVKIQLAKEHFLERLEKERQQVKEEVENQDKIDSSEAVSPKPTEGDAGLKQFQLKAKPGTLVPGEKDWVVGKYGRVLPVVNIRKKGSSKTMTVDPSKFTHCVKAMKADDGEDIEDNMDVKSLTWKLDEQDNEITKKRKGDFPQFQHQKKKTKGVDAATYLRQKEEERQRLLALEPEIEVVAAGDTVRLGLNSSGHKYIGKSKYDSDFEEASENEANRTAIKDIDLSKFDTDSNDDNVNDMSTDTFTKGRTGGKKNQLAIDNKSVRSLIPPTSANYKPMRKVPEFRGTKCLDNNKTESTKVITDKIMSKSVSTEKIQPKSSQANNVASKHTVTVANSEKTENDESSSEDDSNADEESNDSMLADSTDSEDEDLTDESEENEDTNDDESDNSTDSDDVSSPDTDEIFKMSQNNRQLTAQLVQSKEPPQKIKQTNKSMDRIGSSVSEYASGIDFSSGSFYEQTNNSRIVHDDNEDDESDFETLVKKAEENLQSNKEQAALSKSIVSNNVIHTRRVYHSSSEDEEGEMSSEVDKSKSIPENLQCKVPANKMEDEIEDTSADETDLESDRTSSSDDDDTDAESPVKKCKAKEDEDMKHNENKRKIGKEQIEESASDDDDDDDDDDGDDSDVESREQGEDASSSDGDSKVLANNLESNKLNEGDEDSEDVGTSDESVDDDSDSEKSISDESDDDFKQLVSEEVAKVATERSMPVNSNKSKIENAKTDKTSKVNPEVKNPQALKVNKADNKQTDKVSVNTDIGLKKGNNESKCSVKEADAVVNVSKESVQPKRKLPVADKEETDKKRLLAVKQRVLENQAQKSAIQIALSKNTSGAVKNKRIVFDSDSETESPAAVKQTLAGLSSDSSSSSDDEEEKPKIKKAAEIIKESKQSLKTDPPSITNQTSKTLFDNSEDEDDESDDDKSRFDLRPEFEGSAGRKLMKLQSKYGDDQRFKLDKRFEVLDSDGDEEEEEQVVPGADSDDEKTRSLKILQSIVGTTIMRPPDAKEKAKKTFKDVSNLKYDPSKEEHSQFEIKTEKKKKDKKKTAVDGEEEKESAPVPEVSQERFFQVSDSLKSVFTDKSKREKQTNQGFSLLAAFGQQNSEAEDSETNEDAIAIPIPASLRTDHLSLDNRFKVTADHSDSDDQSGREDEEEGEVEKMDVEQESVEMETEDSSVTKPNISTFFFTEDDERLIEGAMFYRTLSLDEVREKWLKTRHDYIENYRSKHKRSKRNNTGSTPVHKPGQKFGSQKFGGKKFGSQRGKGKKRL